MANNDFQNGFALGLSARGQLDYSLPSGTNIGDLLIWNGTEWKPKPFWWGEYQPVEYIQSTGTQYIDTGVSNMRNKYYEGTIITLPNQPTAELNAVGGMYATWESTLANVHSTGDGMSFHNQSGATGYSPNFSITPNTDIIFSATPDSVTVNGETKTIQHAGSYKGSEFRLFGCVDNASPSAIKLKSFSIKNENNQYIRKFVPCYRRVDNEIGLYDLINNVFYANDGTGTFLKGADVN